MKYIFLTLIILSFSSYGATSVGKKKVTIPRPSGFVFDHPEIQDSCENKALCGKAAAEFCQSKKSKLLRCSEQYKENWILTCVCL